MIVANNADDYAAGRIGIFFPGFPASLTGQCVSLIKWYLGEMCNITNWQDARGNAKDYCDNLINQGLAYAVDISQRQRGDIVVWKADGGGYGHIGVLLSNDQVFEENVGLIGVPSQNVADGQGGYTKVYASRTDPLGASWRKGAPSFYRMNSYHEVNPTPNATVEQVQQDYIDILERPADQGGIDHYVNFTNTFVRADLQNSQEYKTLQANKVAAQQAAEAQAAADETRQEAQAQADADAKAAADKAASDAAIATAQTSQPSQPPVVTPHINLVPPASAQQTTDNWLTSLLKVIIQSIINIFKKG